MTQFSDTLKKRLSVTSVAIVLLLLPTATALQSCSCSDDDNRQPEKVSSRVTDRKAYNLGQEHARLLIEHADDNDLVEDGLLDIRSRMSNIESNLGKQSAVDYERGFTDYVRANCDSLARIIF